MKKPVTWISKSFQTLQNRIRSGWLARTSRPETDSVSQSEAEKSLTDKTPDRIKDNIFNNFYRLIGRDKNAGRDNDCRVSKSIAIKPPKSLAYKILLPVIVMACLIGIYALLGFYAVPAFLKSKFPDIIKEETGRKSSIAKIEFHPFKMDLKVYGFKLLEKNGKVFVSLEKLRGKVNPVASLKQLMLIVEDVSLNKPYVHFIKNNNGKFNFDDLIKSKKTAEKQSEDGKLLPLKLAVFSISDGKVLWDDNHFKKPVSEELSPINLKLTDLSTLSKSQAKLELKIKVKSGGELTWQGKAGIDPLFSEGTIKLDNLKLERLSMLAMSDTATFDIQGHELFNLDYRFGLDKKNPKLTVKKTKLELKNFQFTDRTKEKNQIKAPQITLQTDAGINTAKDKLEVVLKKLSLNIKALAYANEAPEPMFLSVPEFSHEADIKIEQLKDVLAITSNKALINIKNTQFNGLNEQLVEAKIPDINLETSYAIGIKGQDTAVNLKDGKFSFRDLIISEQGEQKNLIHIPHFDIAGILVNLKNKEVLIDSITSKDAEFEAWLTKEGELNYQAMLSKQVAEPQVTVAKPDYTKAKVVNYQEASNVVDGETPENTSQGKKSAGSSLENKDWQVKVSALEFQNFAINFTDNTQKKPVKVVAKPIHFKVNDYINKADAELPFELDIGVNESGSIKLKGKTIITPLTAKVDVDIKNIGLERLQPYVDQHAKVDIIDGKLNVTGKLDIHQLPEQPIDIKFKGDTGIAELITRDQILNKDLIKWENLTFKNLDVDLVANRYTATTLLIEKPYARVTIRKDKTINFSDLVVKQNTKTATPNATVQQASLQKPSASASEQKPEFKLDKVQVVDGSSDFADLSLILPFAAQIKSLDGGADGISSDQKSTIKVNLKGNAYELAPVDIEGEVKPYLGDFDIKLNFDGLPMPLVTPYMVQFAGYKVEKGKLTLGLQYKVEDRKLQAANSILIDQLELGEKVENPNAVSLPLELAIALLKDSDGKINLDVPLTGSLEDPKFNVGAIVVDALVNVLTKIVTSPFKALASLADSDADLSTVNFSSGGDKLAVSEMSKLDDVAKALNEKPALNLEIKGAAFEEQDWPILSQEALLDELKKTKAEELSKEQGKRILPEYVELTEDDYKKLLADEFVESFPDKAEKTVLGPPKLADAPPTDFCTDVKDFFASLFGFITKPFSDEPPKKAEEFVTASIKKPAQANKGDFYSVAQQKLAAKIKPDPKRLKDLASQRAQAIAKYLVNKAGIPNSRIYILDSAVNPKRDSKAIASTLSLKVN
jgi:outer membrane protein OmpA-like peptidoglycan-associated protein